MNCQKNYCLLSEQSYYLGIQPSNEKIEGPYPTVVKRNDGTKCPVVQDFTYGKYIGNLELVFDENGTLKSWNGNPVLLNSTVKQDPFILKKVQQLSVPITSARNVSKIYR